MKRNLRFWGGYTAEMMGIILGIVLLLEAISFLFGYRFASIGVLLSRIRSTLPVSASAVLFLSAGSAQVVYTPLLLSHGETRKNTFIGHTLTKLAICLMTILLSSVLALLSKETTALRSLPAEALFLLCMTAYGGIVGTLLTRTKWLGTLLLGLSTAGIGGVIGYLSISSNTITNSVSALQELTQTTHGWMYAAAAVLTCIDLCVHWAALREREVRL